MSWFALCESGSLGVFHAVIHWFLFKVTKGVWEKKNYNSRRFFLLFLESGYYIPKICIALTFVSIFTFTYSYVSSYRTVMRSGDFSSSSLVANPVDAYHLVKRLTIDWDVVERVLEAESNSSRSKFLLQSAMMNYVPFHC